MEVPVYDTTTELFARMIQGGVKFYTNAGPNFVDDGLKGWLEFNSGDNALLLEWTQEMGN